MATAVSTHERRISVARRARATRVESASRRRRYCAIGFLLLVLIGMVLLHVWLRLRVVRTGYVLATASRLQSRLEQESRELKVELAMLTTQDRLETMARKRLGMASPEKGQVIVLP